LWNFSWFFHSSALFYVPQLIIGLIITVQFHGQWFI
jgi:hypothetical protein